MDRPKDRPSPNPKAETRLTHGVPPQHQRWPGHDLAMRPRPDHGEESYLGSGKLEGRRALITGGDSGIGRAVAIAFAREGAAVAIAYFDEHEDAQETLRWVKEAGREGLAISGDLVQEAHCKEVVRQAAEGLGGLDLLVLNAGVHFEAPDWLQVDASHLERTFRTNLFSPFWIAQAAVPRMPEGGAIVLTGSVTGFDGHPKLMDYAASKGGVHTLTKSLAQALADRGIRVNAVAPGPVWTPLIVSTRAPEDLSTFGQHTLWHRPAQPAEIAPFYVFLASADSRYCTGEILAPTGDVLAR